MDVQILRVFYAVGVRVCLAVLLPMETSGIPGGIAGIGERLLQKMSWTEAR